MKPGAHFAQQVRNPLAGVPAADVDHPLRKDVGIDRAVPPESFGEGRIARRRCPQRDVGHPQDGGDRERLQCRGSRGLHYRLQVRHVAGNVDGGDLALAVRILAEPADQAGQDEARVVDPVAKRDEIAIGLHDFASPRKVENGLLLFAGEDGTALEPIEERLKIWLADVPHMVLQPRTREQFASLSHRSLQRQLTGYPSM